jgi:putative addiction module killer protein
MDAEPRLTKNYVAPSGKAPLEEWLLSLKDKRAVARILQRIDRIRLGNFGDCRSVGDGVYELRIHFGPGFRVYFGVVDSQLILLLCGGNKSSQQKDITVAQSYWKEYQENAN